VGALGRITTKLTHPSWTAMLAGASTVVTQSVQLWLNAPTGWTGDPAPVVTGFDVTPIDTWLDESEAIAYEYWQGTPPVGMAILCGTLPWINLPAPSNSGFPAQAAGQVLAAAEALLAQAAPLWPSLVGANGFDWSALVDPNSGVGPARLGSQVFVAAINPWDQYVQTPTNNSSTRLAPDGSGYSNLYLAGDWTDYGYNLGCFEGAVMSGLMAANAITGNPRPILRDPYAGS
jgi:flavin-dependent amine oxidoreductase